MLPSAVGGIQLQTNGTTLVVKKGSAAVKQEYPFMFQLALFFFFTQLCSKHELNLEAIGAVSL